MQIKSALFVAASAFPSVLAWGTLGHQTVALLAQQYLLPGTIKNVQALLGDTSPFYQGRVATWADSFRSEPGQAWSAPLHYINPADENPPDSCVVHSMDCPEGGCITSALANYTLRVQNKKLPIEERAQALKFIIHFTGDIAQPLHTETYGQGGNNITVFFNGSRTNLHAAWDTHIPNSIFGLPSTANITFADSLGFASNLGAAINVGKFKRKAAKWVRKYNVHSLKAVDAVVVDWAEESNQYVCDYVLSKDPSTYNGTEIAGDYTTEAYPIVEEVIARAGVRLSAWLNLIFEGKTGW